MAERKNTFGGFTIYLSLTFGDNSTNCPPLHAHTHTYTHIHTYTCTHIHVHRTCVCTCVCLSVCMCVCACVYYVCVCIHVCVGVCSCHMNLTFMVNYTCRYFRDATLNICKCPSRLKTLAGKATVLSSRRNWHIIRCLLYCVMCVSMIMFVYDYTYLYRYTRILYNRT